MNFQKSIREFFFNLTKVQKILLLLLAFVLCVEVFFLVKRIFSPRAFTVFVCEDKNYSEIIPCSGNARKKTLPCGNAYFRFSQKQMQTIFEYLSKNETASFSLLVRFFDTASADAVLEYGFLFENDFDEKGNLLENLSVRPSVKINVHGISAMMLSLSAEKNTKKIPYGFSLSVPCELAVPAVSLEKPFVGYDKTKTVPHFGFAPTGSDVFMLSSNDFDFSGASFVFPTQNTLSRFMPNIVVSFLPLPSYDEKLSARVLVGGETVRLYRTKSMTDSEKKIDTYTLQTAALSNPFSKASAGDGENHALAFFMTENFSDAQKAENRISNEENADEENSCMQSASGKILKPISCDIGEIVSWKKEKWRRSDFEIFRWDRFPRVLIFDTQDYEVQNELFRRLAFFVEKAGFKSRLLSDDFLKDKHAYNAHDYKAADLARFFTKAENEHFSLNEKERALCDVLLAEKIIVKTENGFEALEDGAVIAISQESNAWLRSRLLTHEGWHGIFFTDEAFRSMVAAVFCLTNESARAFLKGYWASQLSLSYDTNDDYLVQNEFMAYLLQQRADEVGKYFVKLAKWNSVQKAIPDLASYVIETGGSDFTEAARLLSDYVFEKWGLEAGRVSLVD